MTKVWIRAKDIPEYFSIGRAYAYQIAREFTTQADERDLIRSGRVLLLRLPAFERWWQERSKK